MPLPKSHTIKEQPLDISIAEEILGYSVPPDEQVLFYRDIK